MNRRYQMNFEVGVPVARAWEAFTDPDELSRLLAPPPEGAVEQIPYTQKVLEVDPMRLLRWSQEADHLADRAEFTVVFEATTDGTQLTITRDSFGEGEEAEVFSVSNGLGWEHGFRDLVLYLETGQIVKRHYFGASKSCTGMLYAERDWGVEVLRVNAGSFAEQVGLARGDRLVRFGDVPIYVREDIWLLLAEHGPGVRFDVEFIRNGEQRSGVGELSDLSFREIGE
jgi:uncharacterized protein YndB with AHSA1/START domain